ncbi:uncharacterized protein LOC124929725 [Impatiens glandulifera]|uniref:uncharacterized protein LOC124929725 n=1 Tax=Impatiens glandulifera TaxID=253017 RepID=UPI001FB1570B|nr:uncharacterized protein LOC124929725 [Impatiens glandulifera]
MFLIFHRKLRRFCSKLRWQIRRRPKPKILIKTIRKPDQNLSFPNESPPLKFHVRLATFNAALFSMAPIFTHRIIQKQNNQPDFSNLNRAKSDNNRPKSILKQSPLHPNQQKSKLRVSINLPDNEISLRFASGEYKQQQLLRHSRSLANYRSNSSKSIVEVLRELDIDVLALQDVRAEEEKGMKPLSDLAAALGMNFVFAESWAPEYGNAILSRWKIKRSKVVKIFDDSDFRNVLKATIDVPCVGELNFQCTHLDHLDEKWRMKQINAIIQSNDGPHILAGGLNSLNETDYSLERWSDISKFYEEIGKPTPKTDVMRLMRGKQYSDAKDFSGECESVVMIAKGQSVQGTCKYGTRVDYILASPDLPYKFVPGSYSVFSSKGTSDHHIVKVDIERLDGGIRKDSCDIAKRHGGHAKAHCVTRSGTVVTRSGMLVMRSGTMVTRRTRWSREAARWSRETARSSCEGPLRYVKRHGGHAEATRWSREAARWSREAVMWSCEAAQWSREGTSRYAKRHGRYAKQHRVVLRFV